MSKDVKRLFKQFEPTAYRVEFTPDRNTMTFTGSVRITGKKKDRPSQRLTFHQNNLKISAAQIVRHDNKGDHTITVDRINHHGSFDEVRLHAKDMLYPGEYTITMNFSGVITRNMEGIYPCFFKHDGVEKSLIATQFESHHARDAFPCIDEPEAKATFELALTTPKGDAVVSNTPIRSQIDDGDHTVTLFEVSPKMSTYLVAFVTGEMGYIESKTKAGTVIRVYATPDNVKHCDFALKTAVKTLEFYNAYFDIPYPLEKCDFLALPDFASGAMENWGCITFREHGLFVDPENTSTDTKQYVADVIAHELTHQWFGNLVTMRWWNDLWLNEGFASWMSHLAVDNLFPEWQVWPQFIAEDQALGLKSDALENTHPVDVPIHHPDEIRTIFDNISYCKGPSMIHMIYHYLGADVFRDGLRYYLKKHSYANTDGVDLWDALEEVSQKPVKQFMQTWIGQAGYPIVTAEVDQHTVNLTQRRFYFDPEAEDDKTLWPIPLQANHDLGSDILSTHAVSYERSEDMRDLLLNDERTGFYRVVYNSSHLEELGQAVAAGRLSALNRYGLLADAADAAKAGYGSTVDVLHLFEYYKEESNPIVWDVIAGTIASARAVMDDEALREDIKPYIRKLVAKQLKRLGWVQQPDEPHFDTLLRPTILGLAAGADEESVMQEIQRQYRELKPQEIDPNLRGIVYSTIAHHGDAAIFDQLLAMHNSSTSSEERIKLTGALTSFKQPELIQRSLDLITGEHVRFQDAPYWIAFSFGNRYGKQLTWEWLKANWPWLQKNLGKDLSFFRMPIYAARSFSDIKFLDEYYTFFNDNMGPGFERNIKQGAETIRWQAAWKARDHKAIKAFFAHKG